MRFKIRPATCGDAAAIYAIKREAFGEKYLALTIFHSPLSMHYLNDLIQKGTDSTGHAIFVAAAAGEPVGYYDAVLRSSDLFLNYIAVSKSKRDLGLGDGLLNHFEELAEQLGFSRVVLDVFASNPRAVVWYQARGYQRTASDLLVVLETRTVGSKRYFPLLWNEGEWTRARVQEQMRGFTTMDCVCGNGSLRIGLVAETICRLLEHHDIALDVAVSSVCQHFSTERPVLIVNHLETVLQEWQPIQVEESLRLEKAL